MIHALPRAIACICIPGLPKSFHRGRWAWQQCKGRKMASSIQGPAPTAGNDAELLSQLHQLKGHEDRVAGAFLGKMCGGEYVRRCALQRRLRERVFASEYISDRDLKISAVALFADVLGAAVEGWYQPRMIAAFPDGLVEFQATERG